MAKAPKPAPYSEADLCRRFLAEVARHGGWTAYPEVVGDILLVRDADGLQLLIEAKLSLNPQVVGQILPERSTYFTTLVGPNLRAVLVPYDKTSLGMDVICHALGITVIRMDMNRPNPPTYPGQYLFSPHLPNPTDGAWGTRDWHEWGPEHRIKLPEYVPDVEAGHPSPAPLTSWKIKAIKLAILLEERPVTRADLKHLELDPKLWLDPHRGWLTITPHGYVWREGYRRDFEREHPRNYGEIREKRDAWAPKTLPATAQLYPHLTQATLL